MNNSSGPALGLTLSDSVEEIRRRAFDAICKIGYMIFCTVGLDGVTPTNRGLEVHRLDDTGDLFIGLCPGKPVYEELKRNPRISGGIVVPTEGRLSYGIRLNAVAEEVSDPRIMERYWELNPGTAALYRRAPENFVIFRLARGEGEILDVYQDDALLRFRFGFGGTEPRPWRYEVGEGCVGCGVCVQRCMTQVICIQNGRAVIDHTGCLECGMCWQSCPLGVIEKNGWGEQTDDT